MVMARPSPGSSVDGLAGEHVGGHVSQDDAAGGDLVVGEVDVPEVVRDGLIPVVRLRDEQVGMVGRLRRPREVQAVSPV